MSSKLLDSQLEILKKPKEAITISITGTKIEIVDCILHALGG